MNATSVITLMPNNKAELEKFVRLACNEIEFSDVPVTAWDVRLKFIEEAISRIRDHIKETVISEVEKHGGKDVNLHGVTFNVMTRRAYDYGQDKVISSLKEQIKERETLLRSLKCPIADTQTGEVIDPVPFKTSTFISIKL